MKIELNAVFNYPLTPVPLCLGDVHGSKHNTSKSLLARHLEKKIAPDMIDVLIIDAMYFIRTLDTNDMPIKYGDLARYIL